MIINIIPKVFRSESLQSSSSTLSLLPASLEMMTCSSILSLLTICSAYYYHHLDDDDDHHHHHHHHHHFHHDHFDINIIFVFHFLTVNLSLTLSSWSSKNIIVPFIIKIFNIIIITLLSTFTTLSSSKKRSSISSLESSSFLSIQSSTSTKKHKVHLDFIINTFIPSLVRDS